MAIDLDVHGNTKPLEAAVQAAINRIRRQPIKITVDDKGATQPLGNMKRAADEFSKSMEAANARILAFGASMAIINGVADAFKGMVRNLVEVEKSLADINVVMGLSTQNLDKFGDGLFKVAKETGAAFRVAADAATEYARQGLAVEETLKRTRDALVLTRLTGMDSAEAVKSLTAAMNTYGNQIKDTTQLVSKFAAVDVQFAVSAEDFAAAISRTGQAAKSAGVDIDELIGIVTSAQQQTARGGAVIGNALKTIFTKTGRTDTLNQLENLGIAVRDLEGNTIGAKRILTDLANTFDTLSEAQKAQITQTMGGLFHINILKAVLSDAAKQNGILANATQISANATDEAIQKNEQLRATMSAMATETGLAVKQLSVQIGELMLAPGMEKILNAVKSIAEGAGDLLGDGESSGSKFANGFLKGLGNIITGPGLVVLSAVFIKLFGTAVKFTKESLTSLIGVTSEAQKQKAIQTSLVALIGQNAALGKEMLRTDTTRTEKERVLLGLLQMQTAEAERLNAVSQKLAATLYTKGYGPGLTQGKRRAYGHIPNFADPERAQAAKGGYAAGSIRTMNMPGEGLVIYNSAETVKNFAGFKQPAIMPPQSSKAGKNYQQAFGSIHGFDPYAAGGYIPNYAKSGEGSSIINKDKKMVVFAASMDRGGKYAGINDDLNNIFSIKPQDGGGFKLSSDPTAKGFSRVNVPYFGISKKDAQIDEHKDFQSLINGRLIEAGQKVAGEIATKILGKNYSVRDLKEGDVAAASGNIFEAAIMALQGGIAQEAREKDPGGTALLDIPRAGRDKLWEVFGAEGFGGLGAEAKIALGGAGKIGSHLKSAAEKFYKIERKGKDPFAGRKTSSSKTSDLIQRKGILSNRGGRLFVGDEPWSSRNEKQTALLQEAGFKPLQSGKFSKVGLNSQLKAYGHIPNFADPLSDAIGREKAAGVPVSQIRVGSHSALMNKGNPLGLGVTNTYDEPNGLRDVFGANGFVPNYAVGDFMGSVFGKKTSNFDFLDKEIKSLRKSVNKYQKTIVNLEIESAKGKNVQSQLNEAHKKLANTESQLTAATDLRKEELNKTSGRTRSGGLVGGYQAMSGKLSSFNKRFSNTAAGRALSGTGAQMGLMMGLPMAGGFLQDSIGGTAGAGIGGALSGAGTGASLGMMFGPLGTAIGATVGGLYGLVSGLSDAEEAAKEKAKAEMDNAKNMGTSLASVFSQFPEIKQNLKDFREKYNEKEALRAEQAGIFKTINVPAVYGLGYSRAATTEKIKDPEAQARAKGYRQEMADMVDIEFSKALKQLPKDYQFTAAAAEEGKTFTGTGEEYAKELKKVKNVTRKTAMYESFVKAQLAEEAKMTEAKKEQARAVIIQLNLQKAMIASQKKAAEAQLDIKEKFLAQSAILDSQEKLMSGFITEQQKAQLNYNKAINKAAEAFEQAEATANATLKSGILQQIGSSETLQQELKKALSAKGEGAALVQDISDKVAGMSANELIAKLKEIQNQNQGNADIQKAINLLMETELQKRQNSVDLAQRQKEISEGQASAELKINKILADRKTLMQDMERSISGFGRDVDVSEKLRQSKIFKEEQEFALRQGFGYQSDYQKQLASIKFRRETILPKQKQGVEEQYTGAQLDILKSTAKAGGVGFTDEELYNLMQKTDPAAEATKAVRAKQKADFEDLGGLPEMQALREKSQVKNVATGEIYSTLTKEQASNLERMEQLQSLINDKNSEFNKIAEDNSNEFERQNTLKQDALNKLDEQLTYEEKILKARRKQETGPGAFNRGMKYSMDKMREDVEFMDYELGQKIPFAFADGMANAMTEALNGTKNIKDSLTDAAISFLGMIQQAMMQKAVYSIVGGMPMPFSRGGNVRNYSNGGGVPARVSNGEYLMGRDAVKKYGGAFMHSLNAGGRIPGFSDGGVVEQDLIAKGTIRRESDYAGSGAAGSALASGFGGGRGFKSGRQYQRQAMSSFFYSQSDNVGLAEDTAAIGSILQEEERRRQEAERKRQEKKAKRRKLIGMIAGTAVSWGLSGGFGPKAPGTGGVPVGQEGNVRIGQYYGGPIRKYASGGYISGKSGIDQIPAMLSEGEYVIRASSARQLGKPMLDRINAGKFNEGGAVSELMSGSETGTSGGNTNNINISINMERGSGSKKETSGQDKTGQNPADRSSGEQNNAALAERIKQQVVAVIVEEQRPGGLLDEKS